MLEAQDGGCTVCERRPSGAISLHVDHDHRTGRIRGLLCFRCSNAIGDLEDDPELLTRGAEYVLNHRIHGRLAELQARRA